jgi:hypothetical protein
MNLSDAIEAQKLKDQWDRRSLSHIRLTIRIIRKRFPRTPMKPLNPCLDCSYNEYDQEGGRICLASSYLARCPVTGGLF